MEKNIDSKRKSRNLSEKKRRDQFNNLINELNNLIDPHFNNLSDDDADDACSAASTRQQRKMDKSSVLKCAMEFLKKHATPQQGQYQQPHQSCSSDEFDRRPDNNKVRQDGSCRDPFDAHLDTSPWKPSYISDDEFSVQMLEALDAFIVVCEVDSEARIIYSSDTLTSLLNYTGTCNSLRNHDHVSLFDLINPNDKQHIEKLFADELNCDCDDITNSDHSSHLHRHQYNRHQYQENVENNQQQFKSTSSTDQAMKVALNSTCGGGSSSGEYSDVTDGEYISLIVNFRTCLNLTEIKQKRLKQKNSVLRPNGHNQKAMDDVQQQEQRHAELVFQQQQQQQNPNPLQSQQLHPNLHHQQQQQHQHQQQILQPLHQQQHLQQPIEQDVYMQIGIDHESTGGRSQQSIAEQQQHLMSDSRQEQQEHNQQLRHQQQQQQQQQTSQDIDMMQVDSKQQQRQASINDDNPLSDGSNENNSSDDARQQTSNSSSGIISDENDQPSSTGSDDASDSNQSQSVSIGERRHHYRHHLHHHHHHHHHHHNNHNYHGSGAHGTSQHGHPRRHHQKPASSSNGQQYELVRLMATFKRFGDNSKKNEEPSYDRYKFEEPPPAASMARKCYFICIGRLEVPRFSYDLKIIVPPMTGGTNAFHNNQFLSKHTLKWRFLWVDNRAPAIIGYLPFEVLGTSGYDYYHWDDLDKLVISHEGLMRDGQASSGPYRFLTKGQQWIWLQTKYCIILKPQCYAGKRQQRQQQHSKKYLADASLNRQPSSTMVTDETVLGEIQESGKKQQLEQTAGCLDGPIQSIDGPRATYHSASTLGDQYNNHSSSYVGQSDQLAAAGYMSSVMDRYDQQVSNYDGLPYSTTTGHETDRQQQQQQLDDGSISYTVSSMDAQTSVPKKFRPSSSSEMLENSMNDIQDDAGDYVVDRSEYSEGSSNRQHCEQRRYEKLLKSNDLIKRQSIKAGNSFLSRSLDQFKFILCTHTVIGFDESDSLASSSSESNSSSKYKIDQKMTGQQQQQQQQNLVKQT